MTQVDVSPTPDGGTNARVQNLITNGNGWLPLQTLYALVDSGLSDQDILSTTSRLRRAAVASDQASAIKRFLPGARQTAHTEKTLTTSLSAQNPAIFQQQSAAGRAQIKKPTAQTTYQAAKQQVGQSFGFKQFFDDPVLQKTPSAALALKQYLSGAVGAWPIQDANLAHVQQQLQLRGYGTDLEANGVWDPAWGAAHNQYADALYKSHLAGAGPGSVPLSKALNALNALMPVSAGDALIGFIKAIPTDVRNLLADAAGGAAAAGSNLVNLTPGGSAEGRAASGEAMAAVTNLLGGDTTPEKAQAEFHKNAWDHFVNDISTMFLLTSGFGVGKRFAVAIGEEAAAAGTEAGAKLAADAAYRGPGVIARSLATGPGRALGGAVIGGTGTAIAGGNPQQIALGAAGGGLAGYLSTTNAFNNLPILGKTGPVIDSLLDADGLYYKTRRLVAAPYQLASVRVAGSTFQDLTVLGAKVRGVAALQSAISPGGTNLSQSVQNTHTIATVDDAIQHRLGFTVLGTHIAPSINDLLFVLHGGKEATSALVGQEVDKAVGAATDALGEPGWSAAISRITGRTTAQEVERLGGIENYTRFWSWKIAEEAAWSAAENERNVALANGGLTTEESISSLHRLDDIRSRAADIINDPEKLHTAITGFRAQGVGSGVEEFVARVKRSEAMTRSTAKAGEIEDARTYIDATRHAARNLVPWLEVPVPGAEDLTAGTNLALLNSSARPGEFGIARLDTLTQQEAHGQILALEHEWADMQARARHNPNTLEALGADNIITKPTLDEVTDWERRMNEFLYREFHIDGTQIPEQGAEKLAVAKDAAERLSTQVIVHPDAPAFLHDAVTQLAEMGYKPVSGQDIGHMLSGSAPVDVLEGPLTVQRRLAEAVGMNPTSVPDSTIAQARTTGVINAITEAVAKGDVQLPPYWDATTVVKVLRNGGFVDETAGPVKQALQTLFRTPQRLAKAEGIDVEAARAEINAALMPRDIPRKQFVEAFTDPKKLAEISPPSMTDLPDTRDLEEQLRQLDRWGHYDPAPMSKRSAEALYRAVVKGSAAPRAYQLGASRLEDLFRMSLGFAGNGIAPRAGLGALVGAGLAYSVDPKDPGAILAGSIGGAALAASGGDRLGWAIANLPNRLIQLRNELRFDLSPYFSFRRIAKVNVKMAAEGIVPTINPLEKMREAGTLAADRATLERVDARLFNDISDDADRYLQSQDVFGFYNHRNYEAYAAGEWARQGFSDPEIKAKLVKVFEYGTGTTAQRSALERTANFVFFPFSFDKTLYRNVGGYILDHPAQRYILTRGLAAYDEFNKEHMDGSNPLATSFYTKHLPLLTEAARLNAFAHGISPGEVGGINRPLLNLFLPQSWSSSKDNLATLKRFVPAVADFSRIWQETQDQAGIANAAGINMWRDLQGIPATYADPVRSTLTKQDQLEEAFGMQRAWYENYKDVVDFNGKTRDATQKIRFPQSAEWGRYAGEPITKSIIREIIHGYYPDYNPEGAITYTTSASRDFANYLLDKKGTPLHDYIQAFGENAARLGRAMDSDKFTASQVAEFTQGLRAQAIYIAERDSKFYSLYQRNFNRVLGPLEKVQ